MIHLKAILVESGRAFIEDKGRYFHIAPPYTLDAFTEIEPHEKGKEPQDIEDATSGYGFVRAEAEFKDYATLCSYLLKEYDHWKTANHKPARTLSDAERLRLMPPAMFRIFVTNLQKNFGDGRYEQVQRMGTDMLKNIHADELIPEMEALKKLIKECIDIRQREMSNVFVNLQGIVGSLALEFLYGTDNLRLHVPAKEDKNLIPA